MTERLDRIERILAETAESQSAARAESTHWFNRMQQIVDSNARAIEANTAAISESRQTADEDRAQFRASIEDVVSMIGELGHTASATFERIDQMQSEVRGLQTENRRILERLEQRDRDN